MGVTSILILWCSSNMLTSMERWKALKVWITETVVSVGQEVPTVKFWKRIICAFFHFLYEENPFCLSWSKLNNNHEVIMQCISYDVCIKMIPYISTFVDFISQMFVLLYFTCLLLLLASLTLPLWITLQLGLLQGFW